MLGFFLLCRAAHAHVPIMTGPSHSLSWIMITGGSSRKKILKKNKIKFGGMKIVLYICTRKQL
jgi:hypothetical protein